MDIHTRRFVVGRDVVYVHTIGQIMVMTSGRSFIEVAIAHDACDLTLAGAPGYRSARSALELARRVQREKDVLPAAGLARRVQRGKSRA